MTSRADSGDLGSLGDLVGLQLRLAQLRFFGAYFDEFGETGISPAEHAVLALLAEKPGVRQGELAGILRIKRSHMTKIMRSLGQRGLIVRLVPETDGRAFEVRLTDGGRHVQRRLAGKVFDNDRRSAAALNTDERAELLRLLKKLNTRRGAATARPVPEEALLDG